VDLDYVYWSGDLVEVDFIELAQVTSGLVVTH
jgi:hypothetical protein